MPKRPPKRWFKSCVSKVKKAGSADNPKAVCGSLWHHKMSDYQKRKVVKEEEMKKRARSKARKKRKL